MLYEEAVADSRHKVTALHAIVGTLHRCYVFGPDNRDALTQAVTSYAAKLLKRAEQCRAACAASHLAWQDAAPASGATSNGDAPAAASWRQPPARDAQKVMAGLKRALKVVAATKQQRAASARVGARAGGGGGGAGPVQQHLPLYVEIANYYLYYLGRGVESMTPDVVQQLLELVAAELAADSAAVDADTAAYWAATKRHIRYQQQAAGGAHSKLFAGLRV
jgi:vacuolar protein sorting-associated protein 35